MTQLAAIAEYISLDSPVYAEQVVDQLVRRLAQVQAFPESGRVVPELARAEVRELVEAPYRVIYRVRPDAIEVVAVVHARQQLGELP